MAILAHAAKHATTVVRGVRRGSAPLPRPPQYWPGVMLWLLSIAPAVGTMTGMCPTMQGPGLGLDPGSRPSPWISHVSDLHPCALPSPPALHLHLAPAPPVSAPSPHLLHLQQPRISSGPCLDHVWISFAPTRRCRRRCQLPLQLSDPVQQGRLPA